VHAFGADLGRYLAGEPVEARHGSTWYHLRKLARRNRSLTAAVLAGGICLAIGGAVATVQSLQIRERTRDAAALNDFLLELLGTADPFESGKPLVGVEFLDRAAASASIRFGELPLREAAARVVIGKAYQSSGHLPQAEEQFRRALDTRLRLLGADNPETLTACHLLGDVVRARGRFVEARTLLQRAVEGRHLALGPLARDTLLSQANLSLAVHFLGEPQEAERLARAAWNGLTAAAGPDDRDAIWAATRLSNQLAWNGKLAEAESLLRDATERATRVLGAGSPRALSTVNNFAVTLCTLGRLDESEELIRGCLEEYRAHIGEENPDAANALEVLGMIQSARGQLAGAEQTFRRVVEVRSRVIGAGNVRTLITAGRRVSLLRWRDALEEAVSLARSVHEGQIAGMGLENPWTLQAQNDLSTVLAELDSASASEAEQLARESLARLHAVHPDNDLLILGAENALAMALRAGGKAELGEQAALATLARPELRPVLAGASYVTRAILGGCLADLGRLEEAERELCLAREGLESLTAADFFHRYYFPEERTLLRDLIAVSERRGQSDRAEQWRCRLDEIQARSR
jgi:tetratricopeptide (TPR) repeat protein